jgi:lipid-A-disaccharide synthase
LTTAVGRVGSATRSLLIVVGDHSADRYTAKIIERLRVLDPELEIYGVGGHNMKAAGMELMLDSTEHSVVGFFEVIPKVNYFLRLSKMLQDSIKERKPRAIFLVDNGGFNTKLAPAIRKFDTTTPIYYFISPQIWGSRPWRIIRMRKSLTKMLTIFPFEEGLYNSQNLPARFVGHPLTTVVPLLSEVEDRESFCKRHGIDSGHCLIAIMPGSRKGEIKEHMPVAIDAIKMLLKHKPETTFVISVASHKTRQLITDSLEKGFSKEELCELLNKKLFVLDAAENYPLMKNADLAWAKSGTTTLEVTLFGTPMIIFYRANWLSYFIFLFAKTIKHVGWPNLLAGKYLVPELLQLDCRGEMLVKYSLDMLDVPALRNDIKAELLNLRKELGSGDFIENCAQELLAAINANDPNPDTSTSR